MSTRPEDLFDDVRDQTIEARLAEGLLCYYDPCFASAVPADEPEADDVITAAD